jgi:polyketide synthase PksN
MDDMSDNGTSNGDGGLDGQGPGQLGDKEILSRFKNGALDRQHVVALLMGQLSRTVQTPPPPPAPAPVPAPDPFSAPAPSAPSAGGPVAQRADTGTGARAGASRAGGAARPARSEGYAVIGLGARFPRAADLEAFWQHALTGPGTPQDPHPWQEPDAPGGFDTEFFGPDGDRAPLTAPERLFLEAAWETLERAGHTGARLDGLLAADSEPRALGVYTAGGSWRPADRICALLDLRGPSQAVDTGDSAFLVALHLALGALRAGECAAALVGALAGGPHGAEGVGAVLLKPLAAAEADGDTVHAVLRASAVGHGGREGGDARPGTERTGLAQRLGRSVLAAAGVEAPEVALHENERGAAPLAGASGAATGLALVVRAVLQLRNATVLPAPGVTVPAAWVRARGSDGAEVPRRAAVSVCAGSGSGAQLLLEEAAEPPRPAQPDPVHAGRTELVLLSAPTSRHLAATARCLAHWLAARERGGPGTDLAAVARELRAGRAALGSRLAVTARDTAELALALRAFADEHLPDADADADADAGGVTGAGDGSVGHADAGRDPDAVPLMAQLPETEQYLRALWDGRRLAQLARLWLAGVDVTRAGPPGPAPVLALPGTALLRTGTPGGTPGPAGGPAR